MLKILPHLFVAKDGYAPKKWSGGGYFTHFLEVENKQAMAHYFCVFLMYSPLATRCMPRNRLPWLS